MIPPENYPETILISSVWKCGRKKYDRFELPPDHPESVYNWFISMYPDMDPVFYGLSKTHNRNSGKLVEVDDDVALFYMEKCQTLNIQFHVNRKIQLALKKYKTKAAAAIVLGISVKTLNEHLSSMDYSKFRSV